MPEQLDELPAARNQMQQLLRLIVEIGSNRHLDTTLQRIVTTAMGLTGARYGALGVRGLAPIAIGTEVVGSLYLGDDRARVFTESDEIAARALALAAAVAIDNGQPFDRVSTSAKWLDASGEITTTLLSGVDPHVPHCGHRSTVT